MVIIEEFRLGLHDAKQTWSTWVNWYIQVLGVILWSENSIYSAKLFITMKVSQVLISANFNLSILHPSGWLYFNISLALSWSTENGDGDQICSETKPRPLWLLLQWPAKTTLLEWFRQPRLTEWQKLGK